MSSLTFDYHPAESVDEAVSLLRRYGEDAHLLAGGTSFILLVHVLKLLEPAHVVGLWDVPSLRGISRLPDAGLEIGAMTTHREVETSPAVRELYPMLAECFGRVATVRVRNQATVGGSLAHADPAQDPPPMLLVLDAEAVIQGSNGLRTMRLTDGFFVDLLQTALAPDEVLTAVRIPPLAPGTRTAYTKFLPRTSDDYATVAVGAALRLSEDGRIADVRVGLGSVGSTPMRAHTVEQALRGEHPTPTRIAEAAALVLEQIDPPADVRGSAEYKRDMAQVWTERTLLQLANLPGVEDR